MNDCLSAREPKSPFRLSRRWILELAFVTLVLLVPMGLTLFCLHRPDAARGVLPNLGAEVVCWVVAFLSLSIPLAILAALKSKPTPSGFTWLTLTGRRFVAWDEVESFGYTAHIIEFRTPRGVFFARHYFADPYAAAAVIHERIHSPRAALNP